MRSQHGFTILQCAPQLNSTRAFGFIRLEIFLLARLQIEIQNSIVPKVGGRICTFWDPQQVADRR
jgi:hypothetical protein